MYVLQMGLNKRKLGGGGVKCMNYWKDGLIDDG